MHFFRILVLAYLVTFATSKIILTTCARMNTPILSKAAQGLCITSCSTQNCGTGTCKKRKGRPVCVCSRCAKGGNVPLGSVISKG
ncbi:unnamed protein product [Caenorhabditis bovis]|uniref:Uncharacterized protein n=1 Tax=Caenorhabditis bovis TaxID=2654633 RepID=A0A8S1F3L0_9PELO|nr:unnamed protein product [Caenorhabditis bovis]